jgi:F0F1-type ATP synthase assembly protein I
MSDPPDEHGPASGELSPQERAQFQSRISKLGDRLGRIRSRRDAEMNAGADAEMRGRGMAYGMRMAAELVAAVVVGGVIGWSLDLGFAAGVLNVVRAYERMQREFTARGGNIGRGVPDDERD